jgi:hypothetical protein
MGSLDRGGRQYCAEDCLLQFAKTVHRTAENIAAALIDRVYADSKLTEVREALTKLEKGLMIRQGEGG